MVGDSTQPDRVELLSTGLGANFSVSADFARKVYDVLEPGATIVVTGETLSADSSLAELTVMRADEAPATTKAATPK